MPIVLVPTRHGVRTFDAEAAGLHLHSCPHRECNRRPYSILECLCGATVIDELGQRYDWPERTTHRHRPVAEAPAPKQKQEVKQQQTQRGPQGTGGASIDGLLVRQKS